MEYRALSFLVSLWPVVVGTIVLGFALAYANEPRPYGGESQGQSINATR